MSIEQVIELLADGHVHSGEELGQALGVSRTAVWKQLKKLEAMGLSIISVKGRGYQLENGLELLNATTIQQQLNIELAKHIKRFDIHGSIGSTNTEVLTEAQQGKGHGFVCLAEHQQAGRGRQGRKWISPYGRNIYLSLGWEFAGGAAALEGLSLAVGLAIVRALAATGVDGVELKWPNDVLWQQKKLAGVLLEMAGDAAGPCQVVVGVGINVHMIASEAAQIDQAWVSLNQIQATISRNKLVADLLNELLIILQNYAQDGFAVLREEWEKYDSFRDQEVDVRAGQQVTPGRVLGVGNNGALRLLTDAGEKLIYGGEASLRRSQ